MYMNGVGTTMSVLGAVSIWLEGVSLCLSWFYSIDSEMPLHGHERFTIEIAGARCSDAKWRCRRVAITGRLKRVDVSHDRLTSRKNRCERRAAIVY